MEILIILALIGAVVYLLPYILAAVFMTVAIVSGLLAFAVVGIRALIKSR